MPASRDIVEICNAAVAQLGDVPLANIPPRNPDPESYTDASFIEDYPESAQMAGATYYIHADTMLAAYPWSWTIRRRVLVRDPDEDTSDQRYRNRFEVPENDPDRDYGRIGEIRAVYSGLDDAIPLTYGWTRDVDGITTNRETLVAEYQVRVPEAEWPPSFIAVMVKKLCMEWAYYFTDQANLKQMYARELEMTLRDARRIDAQGKPSEQIHDFPFLQARYSFGTRWGRGTSVTPPSPPTRNTQGPTLVPFVES